MASTQLPSWFDDALRALRSGDVEHFVAIYDQDAVHEFPAPPPGRPGRLEGRDAITAYMAQLPSHVSFDSFEVTGVREVGDELIVEAEAHGTRPATGAPFDMRYVWFVTHDGGRVSRFRDYMLPLAPGTNG